MRFSTIIIAALSATGFVAALPVDPSSDAVAIEAEVPVPQEAAAIEARANGKPNTPADVKKHEDNHKKQDAKNCGTGCENSLKSYHSQASKDSKNSQASKNSKASKNKKNP